ncbi:hypothetical protein P7C70_g8927, partial [Phenoliferia sp. Uapishka_3]
MSIVEVPELCALLRTYRGIWQPKLGMLSAPAMIISSPASYQSAVACIKRRRFPEGWTDFYFKVYRFYRTLLRKVKSRDAPTKDLIEVRDLAKDLCEILRYGGDTWRALALAVAGWEEVNGLSPFQQAGEWFTGFTAKLASPDTTLLTLHHSPSSDSLYSISSSSTSSSLSTAFSPSSLPSNSPASSITSTGPKPHILNLATRRAPATITTHFITSGEADISMGRSFIPHPEKSDEETWEEFFEERLPHGAALWEVEAAEENERYRVNTWALSGL